MRDILFLYRELTDYCGIVGDHDTGSFEPWKFIDCSVDGGYGRAEVEKLLHEGAAVAVLSGLIDYWEQGGTTSVEVLEAAIAGGRLDHLPTARRAIVAGLDGVEAMSPHLDAVYEEYVLEYFAALSRARRRSGGG